MLANFKRLAGLFEEAAFYFAINDSDDDSAAILARWLADGRRGRLIDLGRVVDTVPVRCVRLANARNACLDAAKADGWGDAGHVIVADLDDVLAAPLDLEAFAAAAGFLDAEPKRAGVFPNASPRYYDIWALRHATWCSVDCWHLIWDREPSEPFEAAKIREVLRRQIALPPGLAPIGVRSAFGGIGLYKGRFAMAARYAGLDAAGREVNEHLAFNEDIGRAGGTLYVVPRLMVTAPTEHLYRAADVGWRWRLAMLGVRMGEAISPPWKRLFGRF